MSKADDLKKMSERARELERRELEASEESKQKAIEYVERRDALLKEFMKSPPPDAVGSLAQVPITLPSRAEEDAARDREGGVGPETPRLIAENVTKPRVFVVDDDHAIVQALEQALSAEGYDVSHAHDGVEALDILFRRGVRENTNLPDVILLDMWMPFLGGREVAATLRASRLASLPILIITAQRPEDVDQDMVRDYVFLKKPIDLDQLLDNVRGAVEENRQLQKG